MTGFAGIFNIDGTPLESGILNRMANAISYRGPHGQQTWTGGDIGMASALLQTNTTVRTPLFVEDQGVVIVSSSRLHNRVQLAHNLNVNNSSNIKDIHDTELLAAAYHRWGIDCTDHISGDFSFALWDKRKRELFCVRDPLGIKQFYYHINRGRFIFSTDISAILSVLDKPPSFNIPLIGDLLHADYSLSYSQTIYHDIFKLKPAHRLNVGKKFVEQSYFHPSSITPLRYKDDREYIDHFGELFNRAVTCGLESDVPVGIQVSGGVDSSAIASLGKQVVESADIVPRSVVNMYSTVASKRFPRACESEHLDVLASCCSDWPINRLDFDNMWALKGFHKDTEYRPDEPELGFLRRPALDIYRAAHTDHIHVLLNGIGGDQILYGDGYYMPRIINYFSWRKRLSEAQHFAKGGSKLSIRDLYYSIMRPWLSANIPVQIKSYIKGQNSRSNGRIPWVKINGHETEQHSDRVKVHTGTHGDVIWNTLHGGQVQRVLSGYDYMGALHHIENRYPFFNLELIKFLSSIPIDLLIRNGTSKWILRESMRGIMPEKLRTRNTYAIGDELIEFGWRERETATILSLLDSPACSQRGWIDSTELSHGWQSYWNGDSTRQSPLGAWLNLEHWLTTH